MSDKTESNYLTPGEIIMSVQTKVFALWSGEISGPNTLLRSKDEGEEKNCQASVQNEAVT